MSQQVDLAAYLRRVGASAEPPSLAALGRLQQAHAVTFCFDNIDVLLEQHPGVDLAAVEEKFVGRGRGGYCFEHATLFHAVLLALGYDARLRLARVGDAGSAPRTHLGVVVTLDGARWLCDPGISIPPLRPIELRDGARLGGGVWPHRIRQRDEGRAGASWELWRERASGWELMHTTDELPVRRSDVALGHHYTSTAPDSAFLSILLLARHDVDQDGTAIQTSVSLGAVVERRAGAPSRRRPLDPAELPELAERLGAHLSDAETGRLVEWVRRRSDGG